MRISILVKTFLILLFSFSLVFLLSMYISYERFSPMYVEENIKNVKSSIISSVSLIQNGEGLENTELKELSSETTFIRIINNEVIEEIGPDFIDESDILDFVISIYDSPESIKDGQLIYYVDLSGDIYNINYIYQFELGDYLIVSTRIQSLQNIESVLNNINLTQSIFMMIAITLLSIMISMNISRPIKKISLYAKDISNLKFTGKLTLKRRDEFRDLISSLNEMTFNLKKTYAELHEANQKLTQDIGFEKEQEEKKKHLIMTINHEIKTPLAVMKGMIEGMIDGVGRYKDKDRYLKELLNQIQTIENITQDLTYSLKLEDKMKYENVCSTKAIDEHFSALDELAKQNMIKINKRIEICDVCMNEELLLILSTNLIKNAILYSTDRQVDVFGEVIGNEFVYIVKNKGEIPEKELDKIFESFYRLDSTKNKKPGSGLGLFIVKQIADLYNYPYKIFNDNGQVVVKIQILVKK
jgi:two-component system, OmpR family, sensor histidine kinase VanS